jgi:hypothetical protein
MKIKGWNDPEMNPPDADTLVMMRIDDEEYPVWPGFLDTDGWNNADATPVGCRVIGWLHLEDVDRIIDSK